MYNDKRILAIIPARSGSKGILNKNIREIKGKALIKYTLEAVERSLYIDRAIVSTDTLEYKKIIEDLGGCVPFLRPKEFAQDNSPVIEAVVYALDYLRENLKEKYDYVVLLQPTSPLRKTEHIDEAIELLLQRPEHSLVSVCQVKDNPILMRTLNEDGTLTSLLGVNSTVRRQDFKDFYRVNGAIYIQKLTDGRLSLDTSFNDGEVAYVMPRILSIDIDTLADVVKLEEYLDNEEYF